MIPVVDALIGLSYENYDIDVCLLFVSNIQRSEDKFSLNTFSNSPPMGEQELNPDAPVILVMEHIIACLNSFDPCSAIVEPRSHCLFPSICHALYTILSAGAYNNELKVFIVNRFVPLTCSILFGKQHSVTHHNICCVPRHVLL